MEKTILYPDSEENFFFKIRECITSVIRDELKLAGEKEKDSDQYIDMDEVSKLLKVTKPTIYKHIELGFYTRKNIGRKVLFSRQEILSFIEKGSKK